jgi:hypothetical protein
MTNINPRDLTNQQLGELLLARSAGDVHLSLWDRFKDLFRSDTKRSQVEQLFGKLTENTGVTGFREKLRRFNELSRLATDLHRANFAAVCEAPPENSAEPWELRLEINGAVIARERVDASSELHLCHAASMCSMLQRLSALLSSDPPDGKLQYLKDQLQTLQESSVRCLSAAPPLDSQDLRTMFADLEGNFKQAAMAARKFPPAEISSILEAGRKQLSWEPDSNKVVKQLRLGVTIAHPRTPVPESLLSLALTSIATTTMQHASSVFTDDFPRDHISDAEKYRIGDAGEALASAGDTEEAVADAGDAGEALASAWRREAQELAQILDRRDQGADSAAHRVASWMEEIRNPTLVTPAPDFLLASRAQELEQVRAVRSQIAVIQEQLDSGPQSAESRQDLLTRRKELEEQAKPLVATLKEHALQKIEELSSGNPQQKRAITTLLTQKAELAFRNILQTALTRQPLLPEDMLSISSESWSNARKEMRLVPRPDAPHIIDVHYDFHADFQELVCFDEAGLGLSVQLQPESKARMRFSAALENGQLSMITAVIEARLVPQLQDPESAGADPDHSEPHFV